MNDITCTLIEQLELDLKVKFIAIGLGCGYSDDGILHYLRARYDDNYDVHLHLENSPSVNTGYVAAPSELSMTPAELYVDINSRRLLNVPFPNEPKVIHTRGLYAKINDSPEHLKRFHLIYNKIRQHLNQVE